MNSVILVEGKEDKVFFEYLCRKKGVDVEVKSMGGKDKLEYALREEKFDRIKKLGIVIDADDEGVIKRKAFIEDVCAKVDTGFVTIYPLIVHVKGQGSLDTLLISLLKSGMNEKKTKGYDCFDKWGKCYEGGLTVSELDKLRLQILIRYDLCTKQERAHFSKNCGIEKVLNKYILDFNHPVLSEIDDFLCHFKN